jgi:sphingomyelin phosphodiesterase
MIARKLGLTLLSCFALSGVASAETVIFLQNNTPFPFSVSISRPEGKALGSQYWKPGETLVYPGQRARILAFNRDEGVKDGKVFEFHERIKFDDDGFSFKQQLKGTTFNSHMWQSVQGKPWYDDRDTHTADFATAKHQFHVKYRAYFTGASDDIEYIVQYRYPAASTAPHILNVLAYNTYMRPTSIFVNGQNLRRRWMTPELKGRNYDVLILSEMFDDDIRADALRDLKSEFPYHTKVVGADHGADQDGGVIIVSKWPITKSAEKLFGDTSSGSDSMADKGIMYAKINKQGRGYHIFGTHTQANKGGSAAAARKKQLQMLKAFIDSQNIPAIDPVIIGGDLNVDMHGSPAEYQSMLNILNAEHPQRIGFMGNTFDPRINKCADPGDQEFLDYVLFSKAHARPVIALNEIRLHRSWEGWKQLITDRERWDLSDHFPVYGTFLFKK